MKNKLGVTLFLLGLQIGMTFTALYYERVVYRNIDQNRPLSGFVCRDSYIEYINHPDNIVGEYAGDTIIRCRKVSK